MAPAVQDFLILIIKIKIIFNQILEKTYSFPIKLLLSNVQLAGMEEKGQGVQTAQTLRTVLKGLASFYHKMGIV